MLEEMSIAYFVLALDWRDWGKS